MKVAYILPAVLLTACASSGGGSERAETPQTTRVETAGGPVSITTLSARGLSQPFHVPPSVVWSKLPEVYGELELPVSSLIPARQEIAAESFRVRRTLGGQRLSRYVNCGSSLGEQNADSYQVLMAVSSRVTENRDGLAVLTTTIEATASPPASTTHRGVVCNTTGELERRIEQMVRDRI